MRMKDLGDDWRDNGTVVDSGIVSRDDIGRCMY